MFCAKCGHSSSENTPFCPGCGQENLGNEGQTEQQVGSQEHEAVITKNEAPQKTFRSSWFWLLVPLAVAAAVFWTSVNDVAIREHNEAIDAFSEGDFETAQQALEEAENDTVSDATRAHILITRAYIETTEGNNEVALAKFREALLLLEDDMYEKPLIKGEIAYLEGDADAAEKYYLEAAKMAPNEAQTQNALTMFYLDVDGYYPEFFDPDAALLYAEETYALTQTGEPMRDIALENLIVSHVIGGDDSRALALLKMVDFKKKPYMYIWKGTAHLNLGNDEEALTNYDLAVKNGAITREEIDMMLGVE